MSFVLFYQRLSPRPGFQLACKATMGFLVLIFVSTFIASFFQCDPISTWTDPFKTNCFDIVAFWISYGSLNMVSDVIIWCLPVWVVWRLPRPMKEKAQVILLFGLGLSCIVAAIGRILTIKNFVHDPDITTGEGPNGIYSLIEINVGIIVGCIPMCKALVSKKMLSKKSSQGSSTIREVKDNSKRSNKEYSDGSKERELSASPNPLPAVDIESQKSSLGASLDTLSTSDEVPPANLTSPHESRRNQES